MLYLIPAFAFYPSQEYLTNAGVPESFILGPTLFLLYINELPDDVICDIAIYADDKWIMMKKNTDAVTRYLLLIKG